MDNKTAVLHDGLPPRLTLDNLAGGAVAELLARALNQIADNILDPNTSEKQKRKVKIEISAQPYPDRSGANYSVSVNTNLAGIKPAEGNFYIARRGGEIMVFARNHKQMEMELTPTAPIAQAPTTAKPS